MHRPRRNSKKWCENKKRSVRASVHQSQRSRGREERHLLVVDSDALNGLGAVIRVNRERNSQTVVTAGGSFGNPYGIAVESSGNLIVADPDAFSSNNGGLFRIVPGTGVVTALSSGGAFVDPRGVAIGKPNAAPVKVPAGQVTYAFDPSIALCSGPIYTVPKGMTKVKFEIVAQHGRDGREGDSDGGSGGFAGRLLGTIPVVAGQKLYLNVARNGSGVVDRLPNGTPTLGSGGDMSFISTDPASQNPSSDSRSCPTASFLVITGGGGGGGEGYYAHGGTGGDADSQGRDGDNYLNAGDNHGNGGLPGTLLGGGLGGRSAGDWSDGGAGVFQSSGAGSDGQSDGGDGGGGYFGGGGGGAGGLGGGGGGGGGGGASYTSPTAVIDSYIGLARTRVADPFITLTPLK